MADPEAEVVMPESAVAPEEILSDLGAAPESSSALDIPALDPLLEVQEAAPSMASVVSMDTVEPLEAFTPEIAAVDSESAPDSTAGQLSQEEEDRRLAFEALFNSSEPLPLDDFYASPPEAETVLLPSFAGAAKDHPDVFAPDFEIESLNHGRQSEFTSPELTEVKLDEAKPVSAIEMISERDPLLENPLEEAELPGIEDVPEPEKAPPHGRVRLIRRWKTCRCSPKHLPRFRKFFSRCIQSRSRKLPRVGRALSPRRCARLRLSRLSFLKLKQLQNRVKQFPS